MCLTSTKVRHFRRWNWDGDQISHDTVIRAMRRTPNHNAQYDIDIREFLGYDKSAIISQTLRTITASMSPADEAFFRSRAPGSFDFRAQAVLRYLSEHLSYQPRSRKFDFWLFPEETLAEKGGDCEDRAFLLAALLLASGITGYCVRVVLGRLYDHSETDLSKKSSDHVWTMYKNEEGVWQILEPQIFHDLSLGVLGRATEDANPAALLEYIPYYAFNDTHLWYIYNRDELQPFNEFIDQRTAFFKAFDPSFAISVHTGLLHNVLDQHLTAAEMGWVTSYNFAIDALGSIGPVYNPFQHFDNGYIHEGWNLVQTEMQKRTLTSFVRAGHAIADFYAHTTYGEFAYIENDRFKLWDGRIVAELPCIGHTPAYDKPPFANGAAAMTVNECVKDTVAHAEVVKTLNDRILISGRFAQRHDRHEPLESVVTYPQSLFQSPDYAWRQSLPHHDEIAVDGDLVNGQVPPRHVLYTPEAYSQQLLMRKRSAVKHMEDIYEQMGRPRLFHKA